MWWCYPLCYLFSIVSVCYRSSLFFSLFEYETIDIRQGLSSFENRQQSPAMSLLSLTSYHAMSTSWSYETFCAIWYHLYNSKIVKNTHGRVLLLVTLQVFNFTKSNTPPWVFFMIFKLYKWYQIAQRITFTNMHLR